MAIASSIDNVDFVSVSRLPCAAAAWTATNETASRRRIISRNVGRRRCSRLRLTIQRSFTASKKRRRPSHFALQSTALLAFWRECRALFRRGRRQKNSIADFGSDALVEEASLFRRRERRP